MSDYTNDSTKTKLEWLESAAEELPKKSPPPPSPIVSKAVEDDINARIHAIRRRSDA